MRRIRQPPRMHLTRHHRVFAIEIDTCARCQVRLRILPSADVFRVPRED